MSNQKTNIFIDIITQLKGNGLKQAGSELNSFESIIKNVGKNFAELLSVGAITAFGKASVEAFTADQKALALLDQSLKNVGLSLSAPEVNQFIDKMSSLYGVTKDDLIPAFQTLLRYTGSVTDSQKLTQLAMDVSAGTGKDLTTVSLALGKAYGGNVTSLSKLGTGLTKADLASKNFAVIQDKLNTLFKNDAATAADTYQGKIDRLKVGFHDMQVVIGQGLVDAFQKLAAPNGSIDSATQAMQSFGESLSNVITGLGIVLSKIESLISLGGLHKLSLVDIPVVGGLLGMLESLGKKSKETVANTSAQTIAGMIAAAAQQRKAQDAIAAANAKAQAQAIADAKKKLAIQAQDNALAKASLALKQSQKVFDNQAAELWAATHSKQTEADQQRLQLMNDQAALQDAIDNKDATLATNLAARVTQEQANILAVNQAINSIGVSTNPLQPLLDALDAGKITLDQMVADYLILTNGKSIVPALPYNYGNDPFSGGSAGNGGLPSYAQSSITATSLLQSLAYMDPYSGGSAGNGGLPSYAGTINVQVQIGDQAVTDAVVTATQNASATGSQISTSRLNSMAIGG